MRLVLLVPVLLSASTDALASDHRRPSPKELVVAIRRADPAQIPGVDKAKAAVDRVRIVRCTAPEEEPTEFQCVWQSREGRGWVRHKSRLAIDGSGWHFID